MYNLRENFSIALHIFHDVQNEREINNKLLYNILDWKKDKRKV